MRACTHLHIHTVRIGCCNVQWRYSATSISPLSSEASTFVRPAVRRQAGGVYRKQTKRSFVSLHRRKTRAAGSLPPSFTTLFPLESIARLKTCHSKLSTFARCCKTERLFLARPLSSNINTFCREDEVSRLLRQNFPRFTQESRSKGACWFLLTCEFSRTGSYVVRILANIEYINNDKPKYIVKYPTGLTV